ncbi:MAG: 23S rRNA (adenine(2503)-C(2))-methyltransferase RlmN [Parcubacteria group bacterium]|jgi:23S rRNA (adenine(2503)-C(2))-methyltransferase
MNIKKIEEKLKELGQPNFRLKQIKKAVFEDGASSFLEITTLAKDLREKLDKEMKILSFEVEKVLVAKDGQSVKALLKLHDGKNIETVLISPKTNDWSVCISCQVGCPMNCRFCATGKMGFVRNLTAEEITDQVLFWKQYIKSQSAKLTDVVYMGMGEPFLNWAQVNESLKNLIDPELFGFGSRSISVSTAGIPEGIAKFAEEFPQVNLAISLHFADDQKRSEFMPINKKYNLEDLKKALQEYFRKTNRKVFIEYILLGNINDSREDADKLSRFVKSIGKLQLLHVNLIRYNSTGSELAASSKDQAVRFKDYLLENHIPITIRKSLGEEIQGACGQLAGKG